MGLIKCNECGKLVSDRGGTCFNCGTELPINEDKDGMFECRICHHSVGKTSDEVDGILGSDAKGILCKNCGATIEFTRRIFIIADVFGGLMEQHDELYDNFQQLSIFFDKDNIEEEDLYKITEQDIIILSRLVDRDRYNYKCYKNDSDKGRKFVEYYDWDLFKYADEMIHIASQKLEYKMRGKDIYYYNKYSVKLKLQSCLADVLRLHNYLVERHRRDRCSSEEMYKILEYYMGHEADLLGALKDCIEKGVMGFGLYVDNYKNELMNKSMD